MATFISTPKVRTPLELRQCMVSTVQDSPLYAMVSILSIFVAKTGATDSVSSHSSHQRRKVRLHCTRGLRAELQEK